MPKSICRKYCRPSLYDLYISYTPNMTINLVINEDFFSIKVFFHRHWRFTEQYGEVEDHVLFLSVTSTLSRKSRYLFATLHAGWLPRIFLIASLVTSRLLLDEFYHLIELSFWLIDDAMLFSVCLLDGLVLDFCYSNLSLETGGIELTLTITLITSEPTNEVH